MSWKVKKPSLQFQLQLQLYLNVCIYTTQHEETGPQIAFANLGGTVTEILIHVKVF